MPVTQEPYRWPGYALFINSTFFSSIINRDLDTNGSLEIDNSSVSQRQVFSISLCGILYFPWLRLQEEGNNGF